MKTLLLVDGSSYLYRAFHALPDLRNAENEPTGAIYGVLNMLRRLRKEVPADYIACVFDAKGKTFRDALYPEYKAHRPPMPDDLAAQVPSLQETIVAMGWPLLVIEGVEADDVIGTLAREAEENGMRTVISTSDKDMAQLVDPHVTLVNTMTNETLDEAGVLAKFGVPPERIVDYLALIGDSVDNVPGVDKVGPKTAVKWLTQYGSLDNLIAHADEIGGVVGENLRRARPWLPRARELLTIRRDIALPVHVTDLAPREPDREGLRRLFTRFGFKGWLRELNASDATPDEEGVESAGTASEGEYETLLTQAQLDAWLARLDTAELVAVDTETTCLDPMRARLVGIAFSTGPHAAAYLPLTHRYPGAPAQLDLDQVLARLKPWLENPAKRKLGQNLKYDKHVFANHGIRLEGIAHDTLLQSYVLEAHKSHDMDALAQRHLGYKTLTYAEVAGKGATHIGFDQVAIEMATRYAAEDADITFRLHQALYPKLAGDAKLRRVYEEIELPTLEVLWDMERTGVLLDCAKLAKQSEEIGRKLLELENQAHALAGQPFNLNSPRQIQDILFSRLGLPVKKKTPGGAPSTDEDVLAELALDYPLPKLLLEYRALAKLKSTYTDKLPRMVDPATGRVHTSYNQAVAVTGRLASSDPNLQNIPVRTPEGRRIREAFIAPPGFQLMSADYSQIELRIMAHLSQDPGLMKAFAEGQDIHRVTAAEVFGVAPEAVTAEQRRYAKVINFGLIYGMSAYGLAAQLGIERSAAQAWIERYFARYPGVAAYMERTRQTAREQGYVETVFGRRLWLPEINSASPARRQAAERAAINGPMQGTAADLIKLAMIAVHGWLKKRRMQSRLILQVHDELVLEVPEAEREELMTELPRLMCSVAELSVPLETELGVGPNWEQAH
ncbi:DNA polymerase I [Thiobacter aerophilum]|uniref:DNA polymerase I n=1 Tax=Thiobacter aerophilum TaxID=3121275 RepID=A0ABV0EDB1_9BURK